MIPILIVIYSAVGIGFGILAEDSQPDIISRYKLLHGLVLLGFMFLWFPYLLVNMCFVKRDIWFRLKTDDRFRIY